MTNTAAANYEVAFVLERSRRIWAAVLRRPRFDSRSPATTLDPRSRSLSLPVVCLKVGIFIVGSKLTPNSATIVECRETELTEPLTRRHLRQNWIASLIGANGRK
jgi:hypothetical protein